MTFKFFDSNKRTLPEQVLTNKELIEKLTKELGYTFRGEWNLNAVYNTNDVVNFNGSLYVCKSENSIQGIFPTNTNYYELILTAPKGEPGEQGEPGKTGAQGSTGPQGVGIEDIEVEPGSTSEEGDTYNLYVTLTNKERKFAGDIFVKRGSTGPRGLQGIRGEKGEQGERGPIGLTGETGATGSPGPVGPAGRTGATGPQGLPGKDGTSLSIEQVRNTTEELPTPSESYKGQAWAIGEKAPRDIYVCAQTDDETWAWVNMGQLTGPQGPQGATGEPGATGATGERGETGATGPQGLPGEQGEQGVGVSSLSLSPGEEVEGGTAYEVKYTLTNGQEESAGQLVAKQGPTGPAGPQGPQGNTGLQGERGEAGSPGTNGENGKDAPTITGVDFEPYQQTEAGAYYTPVVHLSDGTNVRGKQGSVLCPEGPAGPQGQQGATGPAGQAYVPLKVHAEDSTTGAGTITFDLSTIISDWNLLGTYLVYGQIFAYDTDTNYATLYSDFTGDPGAYLLNTTTNARTASSTFMIPTKRYIYSLKSKAFNEFKIVIQCVWRIR